MTLLRPLGRIAIYILMAFIAVVALAIGPKLLEAAANRIRGYQLVTLKTKMYWADGKAVAGDKVKTWKIAVPYSIVLRQYRDAWGLYTFWVPVYSDRQADRGSDRYVMALTQLTAQQEIIAYTPQLRGPQFTLSFTNVIPSYIGGKPYIRSPEASTDCISQGQWIDYHGWVIRISPSDLSPERKCAIVSATLDRWTVRIDDLYSKDSGQ